MKHLAFWGVFCVGICAGQTPKFDFPIYKNSPPGRQISGARAAETSPALSPESSRKQFVVPPGFEVKLFATEPMIVNPVAMDWDARGRLWVLELYEYPSGAPEGMKGRDRIKILEDIDADGVADRVIVFADGLNLATGLLFGDGGAYVGEAPHLIHLKDLDGDDRADSKEILLKGFGLEDRHELLNGFTWGPDGYLYMTHGVFTYSKVVNPKNPEIDAVNMNAAIARFHPKSKKFEVFADGTSNPWGVDFDESGNAFVSACVIDHLFHIAPGGIYQRQAGQPFFSYAYDRLPSIVDHRHHMAAYCGVQVYLGGQYPDEYQGKIIMGNIHDNAVHADHLTPKGSSFIASKWRDFLRSDGDGWFRPVVQKVGPDGNIWIADWYDKYPCYQNALADPDGVDREYGRIWRVIYTGKTGKAIASRPKRNMDLSTLSSEALLALLSSKNIWQKKMAQKLLTERGSETFCPSGLHPDTPLHRMFRESDSWQTRLNALWTLHTMGLLRESDLQIAARDNAPALRTWAARLIGERGHPLPKSFQILDALASDAEPSVRLGVAVALRQFVSNSLTHNTSPNIPLNEFFTEDVLLKLMKNSGNEEDATLHFLCWMAMEPLVSIDPIRMMSLCQIEGIESNSLNMNVLHKMLRRISDLDDDQWLAKGVEALGDWRTDSDELLAAALEGLIEGERGKLSNIPNSSLKIISDLSNHHSHRVAELAGQLGTLWGDAAALKRVLQTIGNADANEDLRLRAIEIAGQSKNDVVRKRLLTIVQSDESISLKIAAVHALTSAGDGQTARALLRDWKDHSASLRRAIATLCTTRWQWKWHFYEAIEKGLVARGEVPPSIVRSLAFSSNEYEREKAIQLFGRVNKTSAEKLQLISQKRRVALTGKPDIARGRELARAACLVCHKFYGEGAAVGPDLTGVGRSSLDALLNHVIDPNQIIGEGYETITIETKDGQTLSGRIIEETRAQIRLLNQGPTEFVIAKHQIISRKSSEMSLMPEGLEAMEDEDFRDLIWFILAPPQESPLTPARRRELIGE